MDEDVGLQLAEEEEGQRPGVDAADRARGDGSAEVFGEDADRAVRGDLLVMGVEGDHEGRRMHLHRDGRADDCAEERDHTPGEVAQDGARVRGRVEIRERCDELRHLDRARAHRGVEEGLLGLEVTEDGRGRDIQGAGDVREGGGREAARGEGGPGGVEDLGASDARGSAHL